MTKEPCWHGGPWERQLYGGRSPESPFTSEELELLDAVARGNGWVWTFDHACLCLDQARAFGVLPQNGRIEWSDPL